MIKGGYILQPRIIQESDISVAPPYIREIWNYLLREANSHDNKYNGYEIKRGQLFRSYADIREGTKWYIGWRAQKYTESQTKHCMKFLRETLRITTTKELGGVLITICKYDYYQNPKNYERTTVVPIEETIDEPIVHQPPPDNNKNNKNNKNEKNIDFIDKIVDCFKQSYFENFKVDYIITNEGKERGCAGKILKQYKKKYPESTGEETLNGLKGYFDLCCQINDSWLSTNMSLPIIIDKLNQINSIIKNGNQQRKNQPATSDEELRDLVIKHFATDYKGQ